MRAPAPPARALPARHGAAAFPPALPAGCRRRLTPSSRLLALLPAGEYGKLIGAQWRELTDADKKPYEKEAAKDKARYEKEKAAYEKKSKK